MKKTDLEKNKALKLMGKLNAAVPPGRYAGAAAPDRREQRKLDQAAGLTPFPVKLRQPVIDAVRAKADADGLSTNDVINALLAEALEV
ncbi:hypothetical protein [Bordetella genomosp. 9]|uniref:Uncharacterized protein n=1 Tax=Bordetella genomosp. 9 TaxID=1416803 RepID=A0A1W6Z0G1_9BORD|nr:hypothetical protein [Bordetella genomosp. 9]ARP86684.1 hypothetical protein CAL13_11035 [Bordetella genomosp. 9]